MRCSRRLEVFEVSEMMNSGEQDATDEVNGDRKGNLLVNGRQLS
jgi:hypothetical protein